MIGSCSGHESQADAAVRLAVVAARRARRSARARRRPRRAAPCPTRRGTRRRAGARRTRPPDTRRRDSRAPSGTRPASTRRRRRGSATRSAWRAPFSVFIATTPMSCCFAFSRMCPKRRPDPEVVGEHHHVEAAGVDGGVRHLLQVRRVRADAEEARLALLLQAIERLVDVGRHAGDRRGRRSGCG